MAIRQFRFALVIAGVLLALRFIAVLPSISATPLSAQIKGTVNLQGRNNHSGITLGLDNDTIWQTGSNGAFAFNFVGIGNHIVRADYPGFLCSQVSVNVSGSPIIDTGTHILAGGDANQDGRIDLLDLVLVGNHFGERPSSDIRADVNADGPVDLLDLVMVGSNFGMNCPTSWTGIVSTPTPSPTFTPSPIPTPSITPIPTMTPIPDRVTVFRDDFDGTSLDSSKWQSYNNGGDIRVSGGYVSLSAPFGVTYPYIHSQFNPIPYNGNFAVVVGIQYVSVTNLGNGFVADFRQPTNGEGHSPEAPGIPPVYTVWQGLQRTFYGFQLWDYGKVIYQVPGDVTTYHRLEFQWRDGLDRFYIDGQLVGSANRDASVPRPISLWFGNPGPNPDPYWWTQLQLDFVEVDSLR